MFISIFAFMPGLAQMFMGRTASGLRIYLAFLSFLLIAGLFLFLSIAPYKGMDFGCMIMFIVSVFLAISIYVYGIITAITGKVLLFDGQDGYWTMKNDITISGYTLPNSIYFESDNYATTLNMKKDVSFSGLESDGSGCSIHCIRLKAEGY